MLNRRRWRLQAVAAAGAMLCAAAVPAVAHPHMCVGVEATVLYEQGAFTGLKQKWTFFDERYVAEAVEGLDQDKNGKLDRAELAELAKVNIEGLKEFDYFTFAALAGQSVKLGEPADYWLEYADNASQALSGGGGTSGTGGAGHDEADPRRARLRRLGAKGDLDRLRRPVAWCTGEGRCHRSSSQPLARWNPARCRNRHCRRPPALCGICA
jgi:hypothetical protein